MKKQASMIPLRQFTLPGGFCISVKVSRSPLHDAWGYWQQGTNGGKIVLDGTAPAWRRLKTFGHEVAHAAHDYAHWLDLAAEQLKEEGEETQRALEEEDKE